MKELFTERKKRICVYDDVFDANYKDFVYDFAQNSYFRIGWSDASIIEKQPNRFLHSVFDKNDINRLGILEKIFNSEAACELSGHNLERAILNLSTASDTNYAHQHAQDKVLLYYVNLEWFDGWHGETLFFSENHKDVIFASRYTPGRLLAFDGSIPHSIRPQSHIAAQYRFTLALIFNKC